MRSSLANYQGPTPKDNQEMQEYAARAYRENRAVMVYLDEMPEGKLKDGVIEYAEERYGSKPDGKRK